MADPEATVQKIRDYCLKRGANGIKNLGRWFRRMDDDGNRSLNVEEFQDGILRYGLKLTKDELDCLVPLFDKDGSGEIDFDEFMLQVRPKMSLSRVKMIEAAWKKIDRNGDGALTVEDLVDLYDVKKNPKFLSGEKTEEELLKEFLDSFDDDDDAVVTPEEFLNYYSGVSALIDNDLYFDLMMRQAWKL